MKFLALSLLMLGSVSLAQEVSTNSVDNQETEVATQDKVEKITVTGSHIKRIQVEGPSPVQILDREYLDRTGFNSVSDVLRGTTTTSFGAALEKTARASLADASEANLRGADLSGVNLAGTNLTNANLTGVDLSGTDLSEAGLQGVSLFKANLTNAYLKDSIVGGEFLDQRAKGMEEIKEKYQLVPTSSSDGNFKLQFKEALLL